jgi:hypothetical protein
MLIRLDFSGRPRKAARVLRVGVFPAPGVALVLEPGPRLPFRDGCIDEMFVDGTVAYRPNIAATLDELWRIGKPGALVHLTLPHASSSLAQSRDAQARPLLTLNTFNYYDPRGKPWDAPTPTMFDVERAYLRVATARGDDAGLALARGPFASFIEKLANGSRGSQYRFERWFAQLFGGFEEFDVVLSVVKAPERRAGTEALGRPAVAANGASDSSETVVP